MRPPRPAPSLAGLTLLLLLFPLGVQGQEPPTWQNATELSVLLSGGNSGGKTLGLRNTLRHLRSSGEWRLDLTALRTSATRVSRVAEGVDTDRYLVRELRETTRTAERYALQGRHDRSLSRRFFAFGGGGWERNVLGGLDRRLIGFAGAGNQWGPGGDAGWLLKVGYALTYTAQRDVTPEAGRPEGFAGARLTLDHRQRLAGSTEFEVKWTVDGNARDLGDFRGDLTQSLGTALGERLSLKTTLQLLLDQEPPLERIPLTPPGGGDPVGNVLVPLRKLDHQLSIALVLTL